MHADAAPMQHKGLRHPCPPSMSRQCGTDAGWHRRRHTSSAHACAHAIPMYHTCRPNAARKHMHLRCTLSTHACALPDPMQPGKSMRTCSCCSDALAASSGAVGAWYHPEMDMRGLSSEKTCGVGVGAGVDTRVRISRQVG
eukprot:365461-Chlamydomonas_euryale.AAC.9